jgi:hypothetical protein
MYPSRLHSELGQPVAYLTRARSSLAVLQIGRLLLPGRACLEIFLMRNAPRRMKMGTILSPWRCGEMR